MSMTCTIYKCDCPHNVVDKTSYLANTSALSHFDPYEAIDDLHGYIITDKASDGYDYVKITDISGKSRYYFVTSRELMPGQRCKLSLEEDVLMTWKTEILGTPCVVGRAGLGGLKDMGNDIPLMSYSIISDNALQTTILSDDLKYGTLNDLYYVLFTASSGNVAAAAEENTGILPDVNKGAGIEPAQNVTEFGKKW